MLYSLDSSLKYHFHFSFIIAQKGATSNHSPQMQKKPSEDDFFFLNRILVKAKFALDKFNNFDDNNHWEASAHDDSPLRQV